jgi:hypothetical protein
VMMAQKNLATHTCIYSTLPILGTSVYRSLFRQAGCHIYAPLDEVVWANSQVVMVHTKDTGKHVVSLRDGTKVEIELECPATAVLDAVSGEVLLKDYK